MCHEEKSNNMSNQDNKLTDTLDKLDHYIKQLQKMIKSLNTKTEDGSSDYECHEGYRHDLLDKLHNLRQDDLSVTDYIDRFEYLTRHYDVREHRSQTIIRFVYGVDFVENAFDFTLKIDLISRG